MDNPLLRSSTSRRSPLRASALALAFLATASACAPDSVTNVQATGYNAFLNTIASSCSPLMIGDANVGEWIQNGGANDFNYSYFLDMTSKLYYGNISPAAYRDGVTGFLGPSSRNDASFACIFRNLPPRSMPNAPPGM
ncbi:MAG TPA: hypothetical protein VMU96_04225 [Casimicrobiaceae bacterium]|nr:hypothetical protein [Casimicrobiaceae bacterium]